MKINLAKNIGFCFGVNRAYDIVSSLDKQHNIYILGSLAHNPTVEAQTKRWGIKPINKIPHVKINDDVIITAHGTTKQIIQKLVAHKTNIIDTTCPKVAKIHDIVKTYYTQKFNIIIFGDKDHKEVIGINSFCNNKATVVNSINDVANFFQNNQINHPICLVSQTTQNIVKYENIKKYVRNICKQHNLKFVYFDTICLTTQHRQNEITDLAKNNTSVLIIGGINSANTKRLVEISKKYNKFTYCVEQLDQKAKLIINKHIINTNVDSLGVISGASTPLQEIKKIINFIIKNDKSTI